MGDGVKAAIGFSAGCEERGELGDDKSGGEGTGFNVGVFNVGSTVEFTAGDRVGAGPKNSAKAPGVGLFDGS